GRREASRRAARDRSEEERMKVQQVMTRGAQCIGPDASLQDAARRMQDLDVGPLPVCGEGDRLVGMLTDRDITIRAVARGLDPRTTKVRDVMSKGIHYCLVDDAVEDAAREMKRHRIR